MDNTVEEVTIKTTADPNNNMSNNNNNIDVDDVIDELMAENKRLVNELLFANKCLNLLTELKDHMNLVHKKYEEHIQAEDISQWQTLQKSVDTTVDGFTMCSFSHLKINNVKTREFNRNLSQDIKKAFSHIIGGNDNTNNNNNKTKTRRKTLSSSSPSLLSKSNKDNQYINSQLLYENQTLNKMKDQMNWLIKKYEPFIFAEDMTKWKQLQQSLDDSNNTIKTTTIIRSKDVAISRLTTHMGKAVRNAQNYPYVCRQQGCGQRFKLKIALHVHYGKFHKNGEYVCDVCQKRFTEINKWTKHLATHELRKKTFKCSECDKYLSSRMILKKHLEKMHFMITTGGGGGVGVADGCSGDDQQTGGGGGGDTSLSMDVIESNDEMTEFRRKYFDKQTKQFICPDSGCRLPYNNATALYNHMKEVHGKQGLADCLVQSDGGNSGVSGGGDQVFGSAAADNSEADRQLLLLMKQNRFDETTQRFVCPYPGCDSNFGTNKYYEQHFIRMHYRPDRKPFVCPEPDCGKGFKTKVMLRRHRVTHDANRRRDHQCSECDKSYFTRAELTLHTNFRHLNKKMIRCGIDGCDHRFYNFDQRSTHRKSVHNMNYAKKYIPDKHQCQWPGCDYKCSSTGDLRDHTRIHTGERPYECEWTDCEQRFARKADLKRHVTCHKNLKPFVCQWPGCQYRGNCSANLYAHKKIHQRQQQQEQQQQQSEADTTIPTAD
ncbi:zinc finger protein 675-like [Oppia nitens]|uniref:zinc finger protein 675-like n=1 Tax=Oppia nitens TaxID=1686743 RepID=UPI0023DBE349|nr:zinc finger protein 675-like [Oppia nitens]